MRVRTAQLRLPAFAIFCLVTASAGAVQFEWAMGDDAIRGTLNTSLQLGAQIRVEDRDPDLVSKSANNPFVCPRAPNGAGTSCQGHTVSRNPLHGPGALDLNSYVGEGHHANQAFVDAEGQFSNNNDDGNLNYDQWDVTQANAKISSDLTLTWRNFGLFTRGYFFYDTENRGKQNFNPNMLTQAMIDAAGGLRRIPGGPAYRDRDKLVFRGRTNAIEDQIETNFKLLDANVSGVFPIGERELQVKVGKQAINWGESTILIVNSLNTFNPPDANALFRPAFLDLAEVLQPIGALSGSMALTEALNLEAFYQYDWEPLEIPAPGSYLSFVDVGSDNARDYVNLGFGKVPEDPDRLGLADQMILAAVAGNEPGNEVTEAFELLPENDASDGGQYGVALRYYADWLNEGTEIGFYAANYHSRLPFVSFYASEYGCFSDPNEANNTTGGMFNEPTGIGAVDLAFIGAACPGADTAVAVESSLPSAVAPPVRNQNIGPDGTAFNVSSMKAQLEYPEDVKVYGMSFNTSFGEISVQGEIAYRPDSPLQVDDTDLAFAALQNAFPRGNGRGDASDYYSINFDAITGVGAGEVAGLPGSRYAIPDFVSRYRGRDPQSYAPGEYIRGWEYFKTLQYNLGATYIMGPENWIKANQIIWFGELGATQVLDLPDLDELQIDGPGTFTHASAGTDGTGADGSQQSNSGVIGPSGLRFNPTQQQDGFVTDLSYGYRVIAIIRYDNVFPGISFEDTVIWAHDIDGIAPGPGENFIEGRKNLINNLEMRFGQGWSAAVAYVGFYGGGEQNLLRDRDFFNLGLRYRF